MNINQFDRFRRKICELLNEGIIDEDQKILLNGVSDTHLDPTHEAPLKYRDKCFALFYKKCWRSEHMLKPEINKKGRLDWGNISPDQSCPDQPNYFMHVELEYHPNYKPKANEPNKDQMLIFLHLETNRYVFSTKLNDWSETGLDSAQKQVWLACFNNMRDRIEKKLKSNESALNQINWQTADRGIMQIAKHQYSFTLAQDPSNEEIDALASKYVSKFKSIFNFLSTNDMEAYLIKQLNSYWPKT
jgi:hypothetical protein